MPIKSNSSGCGAAVALAPRDRRTGDELQPGEPLHVALDAGGTTR